MTESAGHNLISLSCLDRPALEHLLDRAEQFLGPETTTAHRAMLAGDATALIFCEPSTRTRFSFELAARRLGMDTLVLQEGTSSRLKGETLTDTLHTLAALNCRYFVLRHQENGVMQRLAADLPAGTALLNAGEGTCAHPTQGLLDALTIRLHRPDLQALTVAIVGDLAHSRVARSTAQALFALGVRELRLVAPPALLPRAGEMPGRLVSDFAEGIAGANVVIALRIQRERISEQAKPDPTTYRREYGLDAERLTRLAAADALLLHPGPVNWGVELDTDLANWPGSLIREQVRNGVAVRMAVFAWLAENLHG